MTAAVGESKNLQNSLKLKRGQQNRAHLPRQRDMPNDRDKREGSRYFRLLRQIILFRQIE